MQNRTLQPPKFLQLNGQFVTLRPLIPERDVDTLYAASHGTPEKEAIWNYLFYGPFDHPATMKDWIERNLVSKSFTPAVRSYFSLTRVMEERLNGYCGMLLYAGVPAAKFQAIAARRAGASCDFSQRRSVFSFASKFCFIKLPKIDNL